MGGDPLTPVVDRSAVVVRAGWTERARRASVGSVPVPELIVPRRFCGPPSSGNGGWTAGALAALVDAEEPWPSIAVSLRRPPPLDTPMAVTLRDGVTEAVHGEHVVAQAQVVDADPVIVEPVDAERARAAEAAYAGHSFHPFPTCFACGTGRAEGDGLRIFPGQVEADSEGSTRTAATWTPDASVGGADGRATLPVTWAALDCAGGWAGDLEERMMVLGRMTARVDALPVLGEQHVVVGLDRGSEGRKTWTAATLYDSDGRVVARAEHTWVAVSPTDFS